jgi:hypothetical protein
MLSVALPSPTNIIIYRQQEALAIQQDTRTSTTIANCALYSVFLNCIDGLIVEADGTTIRLNGTLVIIPYESVIGIQSNLSIAMSAVERNDTKEVMMALQTALSKLEEYVGPMVSKTAAPTPTPGLTAKLLGGILDNRTSMQNNTTDREIVVIVPEVDDS